MRAGSPAAITTVYEEERRDHRDELAIYGEGSWRFAPGWTVAAGARAYQIRRSTHADINAPVTGGMRAVDRDQTFRNISPKVSIQYQFPTGALIYGLYSEGFRPGGINTTNFLQIRPTRTTFKPDRLQNFELGAKGRFLDRRLTLRAAAFYDRWTDLQSDQYRGSGLAYTANVGDADILGVESEADYAWDFGLAVQANALFAAPKFTRTNPDFANRLGSGLPGAPRLSGGLLVRYDRPLPHGAALRLTGRANYVGPTRLTFDPALSPRTDPVIDSELTAEFIASRWTLGLFVTNPANASSNTFAYGNPFTFGQVRQVTPQRPRSVGVRLSATL